MPALRASRNEFVLIRAIRVKGNPCSSVFIRGQIRLRTSSEESSASNWATVFPCPDKIRSGAISFNGSSTNRRRCARGCGKTSSGVSRVSGPNAIKSKSSGRGSFGTILVCRPNSFSSTRSFCSNDSGVSPSRASKPTTAFTNSGEPGGQSTGEVCHNEDLRIGRSEQFCSRTIASRMIRRESPRLEPNATNASFGF